MILICGTCCLIEVNSAQLCCTTTLSLSWFSWAQTWKAYKMVCWPARNDSFLSVLLLLLRNGSDSDRVIKDHFRRLPFGFSTFLSRNLSYLCLGGLYFYPWLRKVGAWVGWWWASMGACSDNNNTNQPDSDTGEHSCPSSCLLPEEVCPLPSALASHCKLTQSTIHWKWPRLCVSFHHFSDCC